MSRHSLPWMKFYPADWRAEPSLRAVSLAARGLWIEMLCLMHEADPRGHLLLNGRPVTESQLSALAGVPLDQTQAILVELEGAGTFSRTRAGVIYSRRMRSDTATSNKQRANVEKRWGKDKPQTTDIFEEIGNGITTLDTKPIPKKLELKDKLEAIASVANRDDGPNYHPAFEAAWKAYPHFRGRSSRPKSYPPWRKAAKAVGSAARLQLAIERFARLGREPRAECGAKAFHLWLRDALYEGWMDEIETHGAVVAVTPAVTAQRQRHFADTGEWRDTWGPRPEDVAA